MKVKKIWNAVTTVLVAIVAILAILLVGVRFVGIDALMVLSGSMEPTYPTGSMIYVRQVDYTDLEVGDPITFMIDEDTMATHRIVEIVPDETDPAVLYYRTKGDANNAVDGGLVHYEEIVGKPMFCIPQLGYFANYIQQPPGSYLVIAVGAAVLFLVFLPELIFPESKV